MQYRHLICDLTLPFPEWRKAFGNYYGISETEQPTFYVDNPQDVTLLASIFINRLRIEGTFDGIAPDGFRQWCQTNRFQGYATTSEKLMCILRSITGPEGWSYNAHYQVTPETFRDQTLTEVILLTPEDKEKVDAFLARPADVPFLTVGRTVPALERDFSLSTLNLPVHCYAALIHNEIVGIASVHPMTTYADEFSQLYVAPEYRGHGVGCSLLSAAVRDTFHRGHILGAAPNPDALPELEKIGFRLVCRFWHQRFWHDTPQTQPATKEPSSL